MAKIKVINSKEFKSEFKKSIESSNINLLLGAGFSYGIADTLGDTEKVLEAIHCYLLLGKLAKESIEKLL